MTAQTQRRRSRPAPEPPWILRLYVAGTTAKSVTALNNLNRICEQYLAGKYRIEVIDLLRNPSLARGDQIVAVPTLVRRLPPPLRRIIGDLTNIDRVLVGLDLRATDTDASVHLGGPPHG